MNNDPELDGKYLGKITKDFLIVTDTLKEASYQLRARKMSEHPIFPVSRIELPIGKMLLSKTEVSTEYNYHFSFLENFIENQLVLEEKKEEFLHSYKDPEEFCCLFVVDGDFTKFMYIPYPED